MVPLEGPMPRLVSLLLSVVREMIPIVVMVCLIPFVKDDLILSAIFLAIIALSFLVKYEQGEYIVFVAAFFIMLFFEWLFVSTGVETFQRQTLLGVMPLWLPVLWAYGFVAIRRGASLLIPGSAKGSRRRKG
jgi:hypothetical protein